MKITILTADFAQTDDRGKINAIGMAWSTVPTPLPQHAVAIVFQVDWHEANERRTFVLELVDEDGRPVTFSDEEDAPPAIRLEGDFEVGRPPGLAKGTPLIQTAGINLPAGIPS